MQTKYIFLYAPVLRDISSKQSIIIKHKFLASQKKFMYYSQQSSANSESHPRWDSE